MIHFLFILLLSLSSWAKLEIEFVPKHNETKQGEILDGKIVIRPTSSQNMVFPSLKGKKFSNTLYFLNAAPLLGKEGQGFFESDVKVIFLKVPEASVVSEVVNGEEIQVKWQGIQVNPTEVQKSFLLGDFEIPVRRKYLSWILLALGIMAVGALGFFSWKWFGKKTESKNKVRKLKNEVLACQTYEEVVLLWRNKRTYLQQFPQITEQFQSLELVLFKYQFKQNRTESEINEVMAAYKEFALNVQGALSGI